MRLLSAVSSIEDSAWVAARSQASASATLKPENNELVGPCSLLHARGFKRPDSAQPVFVVAHLDNKVFTVMQSDSERGNPAIVIPILFESQVGPRSRSLAKTCPVKRSGCIPPT